jgi:hypothetical protein
MTFLSSTQLSSLLTTAEMEECIICYHMFLKLGEASIVIWSSTA